jgi:FkbM family methyltransferase
MFRALFTALIPHAQRQALKRRLFAVRDMHSRLANLKQAGFTPTGAVDGGAYHGGWTQEMWGIFPKTPVWMFEPQHSCREKLESVAGSVKGSRFFGHALSNEDEALVAFRVEETNSAIVSEMDGAPEITRVATCRLESLLAGENDFAPNLLKLDLQGHEITALEGVGSELRRFEVIILEVSVIRIGDVPVLHEVDAWMRERGFQLYDLIPQYYRPRDGALWQIDAFWVRTNSPLVASRSWD